MGSISLTSRRKRALAVKFPLNIEKQRFKPCLSLCKAFIEPWSFQKIFGLEKLKTLWNNCLFRQLIHSVQLTWSRIRESNPPPRLGKPMYYRCTNPALHGSCVEFLAIIASFLQKSNRFLAKRKNRASGGRPGGIQQSLAPAGMASSSMTRWSFSSPFSLCTAESSMPHDSWPIIFLGGRLTMAASVLPTRASGS